MKNNGPIMTGDPVADDWNATHTATYIVGGTAAAPVVIERLTGKVIASCATRQYAQVIVEALRSIYDSPYGGD